MALNFKSEEQFKETFKDDGTEIVKTPEEIETAEKLAAEEKKKAEEVKAAEEKAAADKLEANKDKTPEQIAEEEKLAKEEASKKPTWETTFEGKTPEQVQADVAKIATMSDEIEKLKAFDPFEGDDYMKQYVALRKSGANPAQLKAFETLSSADLDTLEPKEKVKLQLQLQEGLTPQESETWLKGEYKLEVKDYNISKADFTTTKEDEEGEKIEVTDDKAYNKAIRQAESEIELTKIKLKKEANNAANYLIDQKVAVSTPVDTKGEIEKIITHNIEKAKPVAQSLTQSFKSMGEFNITGIEKEELMFDFIVPEEYRQQIPQKAEEFVRRTGLDISLPQNLKALEEQLRLDYLGRNYQKMITTAVNHAVSLKTKELTDVNANRSDTLRGDPVQHTTEEKVFRQRRSRNAFVN